MEAQTEAPKEKQEFTPRRRELFIRMLALYMEWAATVPEIVNSLPEDNRS